MLLLLTDDVERCAGVIAVNHEDVAEPAGQVDVCANDEPGDACAATALSRRWSWASCGQLLVFISHGVVANTRTLPESTQCRLRTQHCVALDPSPL